MINFVTLRNLLILNFKKIVYNQREEVGESVTCKVKWLLGC